MSNPLATSRSNSIISLALASLVAMPLLTATNASAKKYTVPCGEVSDPKLFPMINEAYQAFAGKWLKIGEDWFSSYSIKIEEKNPLLPSKVPAKQITGFVWTKSVACLATRDTKADNWTMRISGRHIKFNEEGAGWVTAVKKGALAEFVFSADGETWTKTDRTREVSVLGGDDAERRPSADDLPSRVKPKKKK